MRSGGFFDLSADGDTVVGIGVFDGVHRGHRHLLGRAVEHARARGAQSAVVTFDPRPREVLRPELPSEYLTTLDQRIQLIGDLGFDLVAVLKFSRDVAAIPAEEFVRILKDRYRMVELWVGQDFALGRGRGGTIPVLRDLGAQLGYTVHVVEPLVLEGEVVSSTLIHRKLVEGDVAAVKRLLGRLPAISGEVVAGAGRGRTINLPTANVAVPPRIALPANGVYAVRCQVEAAAGAGSPSAASTPEISGVANVGTRPTFDDGARTLEVHLLDFSASIYGQRLRVEFVERLRPERRFPSVEEFLSQVRQDVAAARAILSNPK